MLNKKHISILKKSPWKDFDSDKEDNIFTRPRKNQFNFDQVHSRLISMLKQ